MPVETKVVRTNFSELGEHTASARGKMTKRKVIWGPTKEIELVCKGRMQIMISYVMKVSKELFLLTQFVPLELTVLSGLVSTKEEVLGQAIQAQGYLICC